MGSSSSRSELSAQDLEDYQDLTYLSKNEILHVHDRFKDLDREAYEKQGKNVVLPIEKILSLKELKANPFKDRIVRVFSGRPDGGMSFEDFLDMVSVFSEAAPKSVKVEYAFRVYDFDGDDYIGSSDVRQTIDRLTSGAPGPGDGDVRPLESRDTTDLVRKVMEEADEDGDDMLSFTEFEIAMYKAPDFATSFRLQL